jgi:hypothetical protein
MVASGVNGAGNVYDFAEEALEDLIVKAIPHAQKYLATHKQTPSRPAQIWRGPLVYEV